MGHYMCHSIIRSLRPVRGPQVTWLLSPNFVMMRLNVWHMHWWHNSWVSLCYLITNHIWCGSDGTDRLSSRGHQQGKYRRITMLVDIHREPWTHARSHLEKHTDSLSPPYSPLYHSSSVLDKRTHTYTPTRQPRGSPISSSPSRPPLSIKGSRSEEKLRTHVIIYIPECYWSSWFTKELKFLSKCPTLPVCEQQSDYLSDRTVYSWGVKCIGVTVTLWASDRVISKPYWQAAYDCDAE